MDITSIVVATCNHLDYTRRCLESVAKHTVEPDELIIIDNGSADPRPINTCS